MRLLDRRETVTQLEHELTVSRTRLEQEEIASSESWKKLGEKKEQLKRDELNHIQEFHVNWMYHSTILIKNNKFISIFFPSSAKNSEKKLLVYCFGMKKNADS